MSALTADRISRGKAFLKLPFTLASGFKAYKNAMLGLNRTTGKVQPMAQNANLLYIGKAERAIDATSADKTVTVNFLSEKWIEFYAQDSTIDATKLGHLASVVDDQTVTLKAGAPSAAPDAGRIWVIDGNLVGVEKLERGVSLDGLNYATLAAPAWTVNDLILAASPNSGAIIDIPTTTGVSTVTLPATAKDGTQLRFVADGVKNGHTVQYRDATGPLTTALTASKRHQCDVTFLNGKWTANAYVSP